MGPAFPINWFLVFSPTMARLTLYLMLLAVSLNSLPIVQLAKLPVLVEHFREHQCLDEQITFLDFLAMHYWGNDLNDNDDARDNQLPFKNDTFHYSFCFFAPLNRVQVQLPLFTVNNMRSQLAGNFFPDAHLAKLFRPPQA